MSAKNKTKRKMDENVSSKATEHKECGITKIVEAESKKFCLFQPSNYGSNHYLIAQGMIWSNNSCAYDSIF